MALIQMNLLSESLMRTVPVNVILPVDKMVFPGMPKREDKPYKTLYLLHGILGNYTDWVNGTRLRRYAEEHDLAVVMPSGDNAFYVDQPAGNNYYGEFIGKELVGLTRKMFPLSAAREDTYIGGLSMGGYGALRNGLKYHETFGAIVALPEIYMACGDQDSLLGANKEFVDFLQKKNISVTFEVGKGSHEWDFWDAYIKKGIEWLPTEKKQMGFNSGNVGI